MLQRKIRTLATVLRERGVAGVYRPLLWNLFERTGSMDGCTFGTRGIEVEILRSGIVDGIFESFERSAVRQYVSSHLPVVELGGCMGIVSCVTNRKLSNPDAQVVVEANPKVIPLLRKNRRRNRCRFEILNRALAYGAEFIEYAPCSDFAGNSLHEGGGVSRVTVETINLAEILERRGFDRFTLICDIEGHECELVEREPDAIKKAALMILETHARMVGEERNAAMLQRLETLGFRVVASDSNVLVLENGALREQLDASAS